MGSPTKTILILDDDKDQTLLLESVLHNSGFETITSLDPEEALRLATNMKPDLILSDIMMPGMNGYTFLDRLSAIESLHRIPVLMVTAKNETADVLEAVAKGATDYVVKPIDKRILLEKIKTALEASHEESVNFPKGSQFAKAQAHMPISLLKLIPDGLQILSSFAAPKDSYLNLSGTFFEELDLKNLNCKVLGCESTAEGFIIDCSFPRLSRPTQRKLNIWKTRFQSRSPA